MVLRGMKDRNAVNAVLAHMERAQVVPNGDSMGALLLAYPRNDWEKALTAFELLVSGESAVQPTTSLYNAALAVAMRARQEAQIEIIFSRLTTSTLVKPDSKTLDLMVSYFERSRQWNRVIEVFESLKKNFGIKATNTSYSSVINACSASGQNPEKVIGLFDAMRKEGLQGNATSTIALINAWSSPTMMKSRTRKF